MAPVLASVEWPGLTYLWDGCARFGHEK